MTHGSSADATSRSTSLHSHNTQPLLAAVYWSRTSASPTPGACQSSGTSSSSSSDCSSSQYLPDGCVGGPFQPFLKSSPDSTVNTGSCSRSWPLPSSSSPSVGWPLSSLPSLISSAR